MIARWPKAESYAVDESSSQAIARVQSIVTQVRSVRTSFHIAPSVVLTLIGDLTTEEQQIVERLARVTLVVQAEHTHHATLIITGAAFQVVLDGVVDIAAEKARLTKERDEIQGSLKGLESKLHNEKFMQSAPEAIREQTKVLYAERKESVVALQQAIDQLS
jgi:valyl-tRNA synthetase